MNLIEKYRKNRHWHELISKADEMILYYPNLKAKDNTVNIHVHDVLQTGWSYHDNGKYPYNLGDVLAWPILDFMLNKKGIQKDRVVSKKKHLFTVGSGGLRSFQNATMWGTGIMYDGLRGEWWEKYWTSKYRKLDLRAVRGPLTRDVFLKLGHDCPEIYGDPGILMPLIYQPSNIEKKHKYMIIPQYTTEVELRKYYPSDRIISMNTSDYQSVIDKIVSCEKVFCSSLHGIILAEAYGVPAVFFRAVHANIDFKYRDYYASTGRINVQLADNLAAAFFMKPLDLPDLSIMQQKLLSAFPYDLWE